MDSLTKLVSNATPDQINPFIKRTRTKSRKIRKKGIKPVRNPLTFTK